MAFTSSVGAWISTHRGVITEGHKTLLMQMPLCLCADCQVCNGSVLAPLRS